MFEHHITEMAQALVTDRVVSQEQANDAISSLQNYWHDKIAYVWSVEDVQEDHDLSAERAIEVLQKALSKVDANTGINRMVLHTWAELLFPGCAAPLEERAGEMTEEFADLSCQEIFDLRYPASEQATFKREEKDELLEQIGREQGVRGI